MNTRALQRFAQEARKTLLDQVTARLDYVLTADTAALRAKAATLDELRKAIKKEGREAIIDQVAYTWFNRLVALRFMDVNDYQPLGIRILSPAEGQYSPQILQEAQAGRISSELKVDSVLVMDHLNGQSTASNPENEAYRLLLVAACNHLHQTLPFLFESIDDYFELLLPEDLMSHLSIVEQVREGLHAEDCEEVEVIGWLYQFYISEKKDEVFASKSKVKKEDIPAATQLFTPRWIVEYMVQNTLGKLWLQNRPQSKLRDFMPYYIESPSAETEDYLKVSSTEELTLLDQACGSGHILVYGFELLSKIYEEEGYNPSEIPALIIKNNLFGFEIDERAAQLAGMAILMKARSYHRRFFRKGDVPEPHILCYQDLKLSEDEIKNVFEKLNQKPSDELIHDLGNMRQASNFGSLIVPHSSISEIQQALEGTLKLKKSGDAFIQFQADELYSTLGQLELLARKYHCIVDNPPYMGGGNANKDLSDFLKTNYPDSKADLMACFMETGLAVLHPKGFLGMINQHSWMFLSSYEKLRAKLIENTFFDTLLHLGPRTFPEIGGEVVQNASFTFWNKNFTQRGKYIRLVDFDKSEKKRIHTLKAIEQGVSGHLFETDQLSFLNIPGNQISYWLSDKALKIFDNPPIGESTTLFQGIITGKNQEAIRYWFELEVDKIDFTLTDISNYSETKYWVPYNKGGNARKWYGNLDLVVNFSQKGKDFTRGKHQFYKYFFKKCFSWNYIGSSVPMSRYYDGRTIWDVHGSSGFCQTEEEIKYRMALINSPVGKMALNVINPTISFQVENIAAIPLVLSSNIDLKMVDENISISRLEWNSRETAWDFEINQVLTHKVNTIEDSIDGYASFWANKLSSVKRNEESLNAAFIEAYGLSDEFTNEVSYKELTLLADECFVKNESLVFNPVEVIQQFASYTVGCMFGRYSLNKEGLILANQGDTLQDYLAKVGKSEGEVSFLPDDDNIIPVLDDEWFEDDVVGRFYEFLKVAFDEKHFAENLQFVEMCLGKDIRSYFVKDFYKDHIKRYKKRPIYWMFQSPKGHFRVLVYLHRYTPDTLNRILNSYLREFIEKLRMKEQQLLHQEQVGSAREQNQARKQLAKIREMIADCREYETEILYPLATERIAIDLDDGVLVNYNKFGRALAPVPGLNDKKTKDKVRKFDWIDTTSIV